MTLRYTDRVSEQIVVTGTGAVQVGTSVTPGYIGFAQIPQIATGDTFYYTIYDPVAQAFENGLGTFTIGSPSSFTRASLSSLGISGGVGTSPVQFQGNICFVYLNVLAEALPTLSYRHVTSTYTASGAIAITDDIALVNSASNLAMTLAAGAVDGKPITVKRYGAGTVSVAATIDGVAQTVPMNASGTLKDVLRLRWIAALSSYVLE